MNTLKIEAALAKKYKYKPLPQDLSEKYRNYFCENIPAFLDISGSQDTLLTQNGSPVCNGYDRIVVGDYGAFIEFSEAHAASEFVIQKGQEYRVNDDKYKNNVKYIWLTVDDGSNTKIYFQKKEVSYADYRAGKYYVSVHEILIGRGFSAQQGEVYCKNCIHRNICEYRTISDEEIKCKDYIYCKQ